MQLKIKKTTFPKKTTSAVQFMRAGKHSCVAFSFLTAFSSLFYFSLFFVLFNKHRSLVSWDHSFSGTCVQFKFRKQPPETTWQQHTYFQLSRCLDHIVSVLFQPCSYQHWRETLPFTGFAAEFFVVVAVPVPACLHLIFSVRDIGDITAALVIPIQWLQWTFYLPIFSH